MRIENVKIVDPFFSIDNGWIEFEDKITAVGIGKSDGSVGAHILMPGFVDTHVHGGGGYDFMDDNIDFDKLENHFFSTGVTSVLATTLTAPVEKIKNAVEHVRERMKVNPLTPIVGVHLEGPIISRKHVGAQNPDYIIKGTIDNLKKIIDEGIVKIITVAIEECDMEAIDYLQSRGITVSVGHSNASFDDFKKYYEHGVKHMTHFCNAMTPLHHREIGLVGAGLKFDDVDLELISDGIHLDKEMLSLILKFHSHDHIIAITDAMRAAGLKDGNYDLGGLNIKVQHNSARLKDGTLAGSVLRYNEGLKRLYDLGMNLNDISRISSFTPLKIVGSSEPAGRVMTGYNADLVIMKEDFSVLKVFKKGKMISTQEGG